MSKRTLDRIALLEKMLAPQPMREPLCAPVPTYSEEQWQEIAMRQQSGLIAIGQAHMERIAANNAAAKAQAERQAAAPPKAQRKHKPPPTFTPSVFAARH